MTENSILKMIYSYSLIRTRTHAIYMVSIELVHWNGLLIISSTPLLMPHVMTLQKAKREKASHLNAFHGFFSSRNMINRFCFFSSFRHASSHLRQLDFIVIISCVCLSVPTIRLWFTNRRIYLLREKRQYNSRACAFFALSLSLFGSTAWQSRKR